MGRAMKEILTAIRQRGDLEKPTVSVRSLLKQVDRENYLDMCCSRLADSELLDGEDACIDFADFPNIRLSADGLQNCKSYAGGLRRMTTFQLLKAHFGMKPGEDAAVYIRAELWHRSIFAEIVRKIRYGFTNLYVKMKYHRIFSAAKKAVAEEAL